MIKIVSFLGGHVFMILTLSASVVFFGDCKTLNNEFKGIIRGNKLLESRIHSILRIHRTVVIYCTNQVTALTLLIYKEVQCTMMNNLPTIVTSLVNTATFQLLPFDYLI